MSDADRYVVLITNADGGEPASIHESFDAAKSYVWEWLTDTDNDPAISAEEAARLSRDLANLTGLYVESVRGSESWKEWIYISPVMAPTPPWACM